MSMPSYEETACIGLLSHSYWAEQEFLGLPNRNEEVVFSALKEFIWNGNQ